MGLSGCNLRLCEVVLLVHPTLELLAWGLPQAHQQGLVLLHAAIGKRWPCREKSCCPCFMQSFNDVAGLLCARGWRDPQLYNPIEGTFDLQNLCICTIAVQLTRWLVLALPEAFPWFFPLIEAPIAAPPANRLARGGKSKQFKIASEMTRHETTVN